MRILTVLLLKNFVDIVHQGFELGFLSATGKHTALGGFLPVSVGGLVQ